MNVMVCVIDKPIAHTHKATVYVRLVAISLSIAPHQLQIDTIGHESGEIDETTSGTQQHCVVGDASIVYFILTLCLCYFLDNWGRNNW